MRESIGWLPLLAVATLGIITSLSATQSDSLDPLVACPDTHRLLFENALLRVIEAKVPPGKSEARHRHPHGITVYLADYEVETRTFPENTVSRSPRKFGAVTWSEAVVHEVKNVGKTSSHAIRVELK
jgi:hypothetical protein